MSNCATAANGHSSRRLWLGVDLGGTTAKLGVFQSDAKAGPGAISRPTLLARTAIPTRLEDEGENILPDIAEAAKELVEKLSLSLSDIDGAGIGVPGPVLPLNDRGYPVDGCVNLNWEGIHYVDETLRQLTGIERIFVCNDANAAALGELYFGTANEKDPGTVSQSDPAAEAEAGPASDAGPVSSAVMITIGTGIGGGIIQGGQLISGAFGAAGEVGHMPVSPADPFFIGLREAVPELLACSDLEYYASATGIARMARAALEAEKKNRQTSGSQPSEDSGCSCLHEIASQGSLEARHVIDAAKAGDPIGAAVTEFFFNTLGQGLASIASVVDPDLFIIGGGVSAAGPFLLEGLQKAYQAQVFHASRRTAFRLASMGNDAGLLGPLVPLMRE